MEFEKEPGFDVSTGEDGLIVFYRRLEMYATVFYLGETFLSLYRADMKSMTIPLTCEERESLTSPSATINFANEFIKKNSPKWE